MVPSLKAGAFAAQAEGHEAAVAAGVGVVRGFPDGVLAYGLGEVLDFGRAEFVRAVKYQQRLQVAVRERLRELMTAPRCRADDEVRLAVTWVNSRPRPRMPPRRHSGQSPASTGSGSAPG